MFLLLYDLKMITTYKHYQLQDIANTFDI